MDIGLVIIAIIGGGLTLLVFRLFESGTQSNHKESLSEWEEILKDDLDESERSLIEDFLLGYGISPKQFYLNETYYMGEHDDESLVSDDLVWFKKNPNQKAPGFPVWFYTAFPDVAWWIIHGEGNRIIKSKYSHLDEREYYDGEYVRDKYLLKFIDDYLEQEKDHLENQLHK